MSVNAALVTRRKFAARIVLLAAVLSGVVFSAAPAISAASPTTTTVRTPAAMDTCTQRQNGARVRVAKGKTLTCRNLGFRWVEDTFSAPAATTATRPGATAAPTTTLPVPKVLNGTFSGSLTGGAIERQWSGTVTFSGPTAGSPRVYGLRTATIDWTLISQVPNCVGEFKGTSTITATGDGKVELSGGGAFLLLSQDGTHSIGIRGVPEPKPAFDCPGSEQVIDIDGSWELVNSGPAPSPITKGRAAGRRTDGPFSFTWDIDTKG